MENLPFVSVIVPIFNDADRLNLCLAALQTQSYPQSHYEIIVVDNGSDDDQNIGAVVAKFKQAIFTQELLPGSYAARNKGISLAKGEVIAFTDADCIPDCDWLKLGVARLNAVPNCGQVVGKVKVFFANPKFPTPVELYESVTAFPQESLLQKFHGGATANVFTWRYVIDKVGNFNSRLKSNGDMEWGKRVFLAGFEQVYAPEVQVKHPARQTFVELRKRTIRLAGGVFDFHIKPEDSFIQRQKMFARLLLDDLTPPINFIVNTFNNPDLKSWTYKLKISSIIFYVRYISAWEKTRLKLGGTSNR